VSSSISSTVVTNTKYDGATALGGNCPPNSQAPHCNPDTNPDCPPNSQSPQCNTEEPGLFPERRPEVTTEYYATNPSYSSEIGYNDHIRSLQFTLESLPSKDKEEFYDFVSEHFNYGTKPQAFDVTVDIVTGDGDVLQSWKYSKCELDDFNIYLQDNLAYFTMNGKKATSEIRDKSSFQCAGFRVNFDENELSYEQPSTIVDDGNRAMLYIAHIQNGEFKSQRSTTLVQKINSLPQNNLLLTGLPNIFNIDLYDLAGTYLNTGKELELFDFRYDLVTGDGTILFSAKYTKCQITNFATYYSDHLFYIKFMPSLKPEIRTQGILNCIGMDLIMSPQKDLHFDPTGNLRKFSPLIQREIGVPTSDTVCNDGKTVMIRPPKNIAICILDEHISVLEERGWKTRASSFHPNLVKALSQPIPTDQERATSFLITLHGADKGKTITSDTFSKFVPISNEKSSLLTPSGPLDQSTKQFYLESLPSKDKDRFYDILSEYINHVRIAKPFDITIDVLAASGDLIQVWDYSSCDNNRYEIFLDENLLIYKLHQKWDAEIKDRTFFQCSGLKINNPT